MASTLDQQPVAAAMLVEGPSFINPNRLRGPIKGLDYLSNELPNELLEMIVKALLDGEDLRAGLDGLAKLSRTSHHLRTIFEPQLYKLGGDKIGQKLCAELMALPIPSSEYMLPSGARDDQDITTQDGNLVPILWAAKRGRLATVKKAIEYGAQVEVTPYDSTPFFGPGMAAPIHWAAAAGDKDMVECLLQAGARLDTGAYDLCRCGDGDGSDLWFPLHLAMCQNRTSTTAALLLAQDSISPCMGKKMQLPLASENATLGSGNDTDWDSITSDMYQDYQDYLQEHQDYHQDYQDRPPSAIHVAAQFGHHELLPLMAKKEAAGLHGWADPRYKTHAGKEHVRSLANRGSTCGRPIHVAAGAETSNRETINALAQLGADIDWEANDINSGMKIIPGMDDVRFFTPAFLALARGHWEHAKALQDLGARLFGPNAGRFEANALRRAPKLMIDMVTRRGPTELLGDGEWQRNQQDMIVWLVSSHPALAAKITFQGNHHNEIPILSLVCNKSFTASDQRRFVKLFLSLGADPNAYFGNGTPALTLCIYQYIFGQCPQRKVRRDVEAKSESQAQTQELVECIDMQYLRDCIIMLLKAGATTDMKFRPEQPGQCGCRRPENPLPRAVELTRMLDAPGHAAVGLDILNLFLKHANLSRDRRDQILAAVAQAEGYLHLANDARRSDGRPVIAHPRRTCSFCEDPQPGIKSLLEPRSCAWCTKSADSFVLEIWRACEA